MRRFTVASFLLVFQIALPRVASPLLGGSGVVGARRSDVAPRADTVLARARAAIGSDRFHQAAADLSTVASCRGPRGAYVTRTLSSVGAIRFEQDFAWNGDSTRMVVVGDTGWATSTPGRGLRLRADQRAMARLHDYQRLFIRPRDLLTFDERVERSRFVGRDAVTVSATFGNHLPVRMYFDPATGLPMGLEHAVPGGPGADRIRVVVHGWRAEGEGKVVAGLAIHHGDNQWIFTYDTVQVGAAAVGALELATPR